MKRIIINGRFLTQKITGVQRYARELTGELDKLVDRDELEIAVPPETKEIPEYKNIKVVKFGKLHAQLWENICFPVYVKKKNAISLNLCNVAPIISPGIVCIHDVRIKVQPKDFSRKFLIWYKMLFLNETKRAKKIITVSEFSKREIIKYYAVSPERISVIPNAWQHWERISCDERILYKHNLRKGEFFFAMSSLEPNKNFRWIAEAALKYPEHIFVAAGSIDAKVFSKGLGFDCPENMKLVGYITDEEAKTLMRDCKAFLFPTFYEGFGLPPIEALAAGCRNIFVSDTDVMHEIFGDSVNFVEPLKVGEDIFRENNGFDARSVLSRYSWKKSARLLYSFLSECYED